jgi:hypothetical protein
VPTPVALMAFEPGDIVHAYGGTKENRLGVVLRIMSDGRLFVFFGTKIEPTNQTDRDNAVFVRKKSLDGQQMGLSFDTWFPPTGYTEPVRADKARKSGTCPITIQHKLEGLVGIVAQEESLVVAVSGVLPTTTVDPQGGCQNE